MTSYGDPFEVLEAENLDLFNKKEEEEPQNQFLDSENLGNNIVDLCKFMFTKIKDFISFVPLFERMLFFFQQRSIFKLKRVLKRLLKLKLASWVSWQRMLFLLIHSLHMSLVYLRDRVVRIRELEMYVMPSKLCITQFVLRNY